MGRMSSLYRSKTLVDRTSLGFNPAIHLASGWRFESLRRHNGYNRIPKTHLETFHMTGTAAADSAGGAATPMRSNDSSPVSCIIAFFVGQ